MIRRTFLQLCASFLALFGVGIDADGEVPRLSTKIDIIFDGKIIGTIDNVIVSESRDLNTRRTSTSVKANRIIFDNKLISKPFSRGFIDVKAQRLPMQIELNDGKTIMHIQNCWIERMGPSYRWMDPDYVVSENVHMQAESVSYKGLNG